MSSRTQGYPSMNLYIDFWRSGTDSIEFNCPEVSKLRSITFQEDTNKEYQMDGERGEHGLVKKWRSIMGR